MWIRSKERTELIDTKIVYVEGREVRVNNDLCMGEYATNLRAVQVLDLVENNIADYEYARICQDQVDAPSYIVFEMPIK